MAPSRSVSPRPSAGQVDPVKDPEERPASPVQPTRRPRRVVSGVGVVCWVVLCLAAAAGGAFLWEHGGGPPEDEGPQPNFRGKEILQIFQKREELRPFYTKFEAQWNVRTGLYFSKDHWEVPIAAVTIYLLVCFLGQKLMARYAPFSLVYPLAVWNFALAVFSLVGALRVVPELLHNLADRPFEESICTPPHHGWGCGATGLWVQLFIFSKIPELVDTLFIVLRKRDLIFLHWYHHVTVLLYCWHAYATECGAGLYFVAMNYVVHAVMYTYYSAAALRIVPQWFPAIIITAMQIAQMFVGMFVCGASIYYTVLRWESESPCANDTTNLVLGGLMYVSYLALFVQFAITKYTATPPPLPKRE